MLRRLALVCLFMAAPVVAQPPNILLILADDLGWADVGCYGNTYNETPHLDRLAREGLRFTQFYAGPVCSPTRANLQSGRDQARYGITQHIPGHRRPWAKLSDPEVPKQLPLEVVTFAERLTEAGYRTGYFGKWHLGGAGFSPTDQGWQTAEETKGNILKRDGVERRTTEYLADKAIAFLEADRDRPFLLQVSHSAVHIPLSTTPDKLAHFQNKPAMPGYPSRPEYAGLLAELDDSVGRLLAALDRLGLKDNTLVIFVSDNGGLEHQQDGTVVTSNRPLRGEKGSLYEGGIRVPAIARWPGRILAGSVCTTPVITTDLHATFAALAGVAVPEGELDGVNLLPLLTDPAAPLKREALFWHLPHYHHSTPASAVRWGDWKLIEFFEEPHLELYHLAKDPSETTNLAATEPDRAQQLRQVLHDWRARVGARLPVANPQYDPARAGQLGKPGRER
jgi:arylsulfatase A